METTTKGYYRRALQKAVVEFFYKRLPPDSYNRRKGYLRRLPQKAAIMTSTEDSHRGQHKQAIAFGSRNESRKVKNSKEYLIWIRT